LCKNKINDFTKLKTSHKSPIGLRKEEKMGDHFTDPRVIKLEQRMDELAQRVRKLEKQAGRQVEVKQTKSTCTYCHYPVKPGQTYCRKCAAILGVE
jgi:hypothetical protein